MGWLREGLAALMREGVVQDRLVAVNAGAFRWWRTGGEVDVSTIEGLQHWQTLSQGEQARLRQAVLDYERVQAINLEAAWGSQTNAEREEAARPAMWSAMGDDAKLKWRASYLVDPRASWMDKHRAFAQLMGGGLSSKSSLLDRLILGHRALKVRPPTSFSYPWYSIVESPSEQVASTVSLGGAMSLGSAMRGTGGARRASDREVSCLVINQAVFSIVKANDAGEALLHAAKRLIESPDGTTEVEDWSAGAVVVRKKKTVPAITRNHPGWPGVLEAYRAGPEILVTHGDWPAWKLRLGRRVGVADDRWVKECLAKGAFGVMRDLDPLDLLFANLDPTERDDSKACDDLEDQDTPRVDEEVRRIRNVLDGMPAGRTQPAPTPEFLACAVQGGEPKRRTAYLETTCWYLSKAEGWDSVSSEDLYMKLD